jgi:cytochrome P450
LIELDRHPESLAKLLTEISVIDTTEFKDVDSRMPYLDALIWEILRLYPVVHATVRVMNREARLASSKIPVTLMPRMLLYISFLHLQTSPKYWGPTAGEFNPDRFLDGKSKDLPFMPFGYGSRNCVSTIDPSDENDCSDTYC